LPERERPGAEWRQHSRRLSCRSCRGWSVAVVPAQERELLQELKGLEQRVLAEERESNYTGASLAAEEERAPLLSRRRAC